MEGEANPTQQPTPCKTGCGFYGNQASDGLCSKCYKDTVKQSQDASQPTGRPNPTTAVSTSTTGSMTQTASLPKINPFNQKDNVSESMSTASGSITPEKQKEGVQSPAQSTTEAAATATTITSGDDTSASPDKGKRKNRCNVCRKKVGLTGFICRCNGLYCGIHRYSDKHNCSFDYKADAREQIAKQNPVIVGEKVRKI